MRSFLFILTFYCLSAHGQGVVPFQLMRYDEDYSLYENDSVTDWYPNVKYLKINEGVYASFGGSFRVQYLIIGNEGWNPSLSDKDGFLLTRWLLHADLHLSERVRIFAEVQSALASSRNFPAPVEENPLEPHQLFLDFKPFYQKRLTLRVGRQELSYGSQRLISVRDGPNSRRSFDGVKAIIKRGKFATDAFYMNAVIDRIGIFDDTSSSDLRLWGTFTDFSTSKEKLNLNFYYLGFYNKRALFNDGGGIEKRHTFSARLFKNGERWNYDIESGFQFGTIGNRNIKAWCLAMATTYRFKGIQYNPEIGFKADIISGDRDNSDLKHQTFNPLFPPGIYFGLAAPLGPSNLVDIHPTGGIRFNNKLSFFWDYAFLWRYSLGDGIYRPNMIPYFETENKLSRYIGSQLSGVGKVQPNKHISISIGLSWFNTGTYIKSITEGNDIFSAFVNAQIIF